MPEWIDSPGEFLTILSIVSIVLAALIWLIRAVISINHEVKPNSGQSMRDAVNRIEEKLDRHIEWHLDRE